MINETAAADPTMAGGPCSACTVEAGDTAEDTVTDVEAVVPTCDNASVGVLISDPQGRWLMFERGRAPLGIAPVAGHVWDEHAAAGTDPQEAYWAAARAEVAEELGLTVTFLEETGVGGWRTNRCRRPAGPRGTGHEWRVYRASVTGDLAPSPVEARNPRWLTRVQLQEVAEVTVAYGRGVVTEDEWAAAPGIEPVWVRWLHELGLVDVARSDLALIDQVAAGHPVHRGVCR